MEKREEWSMSMMILLKGFKGEGSHETEFTRVNQCLKRPQYLCFGKTCPHLYGMEPDSLDNRIKSMYVNYERVEKRVEKWLEEGDGEGEQGGRERGGEMERGKNEKQGESNNAGGVCQCE